MNVIESAPGFFLAVFLVIGGDGQTIGIDVLGGAPVRDACTLILAENRDRRSELLAKTAPGDSKARVRTECVYVPREDKSQNAKI